MTRIPAEFRADGIYLPVSINGHPTIAMKFCVDLDQSEIAGSEEKILVADLQVGTLSAHALALKVTALPPHVKGELEKTFWVTVSL